MKYCDVYCILCGCPAYSTIITAKNNMDENIINKIEDDTDWLRNCTILLPNNKLMHNMTNKYCSVFTDNKNNIIECSQTTELINVKNGTIDFGIFIHTDCWKYVNSKIHSKLLYNNIPSHLMNKNKNYIDKINYYKIDNYWKESFDFYRCYIENNSWMCISPLSKTLEGKKNAMRLNKIMIQLKISPSEYNKRSKRPSPYVSASSLPKDVISIGNDKKLWITTDKWVKVNDVVQITVILNKVVSRNFYNYQKLDILPPYFLPIIGSKLKKNPVFAVHANSTKETITYTLIGRKKHIDYTLKFLKKEQDKKNIEYTLA
jgi:hypothetical protein